MRDDWNNFWEASRKSDLSVASHSKKRMMRILQHYYKPGMKILDAGCGSGFFTNYFTTLGLDATALDYSPQAIEIAKKVSEGKATYRVGDLLDDGLPDQLGTTYDLIFSDGLFEHFPPDEQRKIMDMFKRLKSPDGVITTFVPNKFSPWQLIRPFMMPGIKEKPFTLRRLVRLHEGLDILEKGGLNVLPFVLSPERLMGNTFGMLLYTIAK